MCDEMARWAHLYTHIHKDAAWPAYGVQVMARRLRSDYKDKSETEMNKPPS